jgi:hypothetical protein
MISGTGETRAVDVGRARGASARHEHEPHGASEEQWDRGGHVSDVRLHKERNDRSGCRQCPRTPSRELPDEEDEQAERQHRDERVPRVTQEVGTEGVHHEADAQHREDEHGQPPRRHAMTSIPASAIALIINAPTYIPIEWLPVSRYGTASR